MNKTANKVMNKMTIIKKSKKKTLVGIINLIDQ